MTVDRWQPVTVPSATRPWASRLGAVIADLKVTTNPRYMHGDGKTWCNLFLTDVVGNMGFPAPCHWMTSSGAPATVGKGIEMSANRLVEWFRAHGATYGWASTDRESAERAVARGHLAVVGWRNPKGGSGHVAVVLGADRIAQAGRTNFVSGTVAQGFGKSTPLEWWVQMERPDGHNVRKP